MCKKSERVVGNQAGQGATRRPATTTLPRTEGQIVALQHGRADFAAVGELEVQRLLHLDLVGQARLEHLVEDLFLRLRLAGHLGVALAEPRHVVLHVLDLVLLRLEPLLLLLALLRARLHKLVVVARVVHELLLGRVVHHVRAHGVHEVLRVAHHEQDLVPLGQVVLQPHHGLPSEVRRWRSGG